MSERPRILYLVSQAEFFLSHRLPLALAALRDGYSVHVATAKSAGAARIGNASQGQ